LEDWRAGKKYELIDFFRSDVFYALLAMGVVILPGLYYPMCYWPNEREQTKKNAKYFFQSTFLATIVGILGYLGYLYVLFPEQEKKFEPLFGFLGAEVAFGSLVAVPLLLVTVLIPDIKTKKTS